MSFLTTTPRAIRAFFVGESYWKVAFQSGRELSELDTKTIMLANREIRTRSVEWLEDICASGDLKNIKEVMLCTPKGTVHLLIAEPYTVFQLSRGTTALLTGERIKNCQVIGRIDDKDTGDTTAYVWDVQEQEIYELRFNIRDGIPAWRDGVIPIGILNLAVLDVRGVM